MHPKISNLRGPCGLGELVNKIATSASALKKRICTARKKIKAVTKEHRRIARKKGLYAVAVTLTYADSAHFCSKHVTRFINCLRCKLKRLGHSLLYVWVLERASMLHYHLTIWIPRGFKLSNEDLRKWWTWGSTWNAACIKVFSWIRYISKREDKANLPHSARVFSSGGLDAEGSETVRKAMLPRWLSALLPKEAQPRRLARIGWVDQHTGMIYKSPWVWTPYGPRIKSLEIAT